MRVKKRERKKDVVRGRERVGEGEKKRQGERQKGKHRGRGGRKAERKA